MGGLFSRSSRGTRSSATTSASIASSSSTAAVPAPTTTCPECEVLRLCSDKLVTAVKATDLLNLTIKLYASGLIGEETRDNANLPVHTLQQKALIITSAVQRRVEADPSLFYQFTELLQNEGDDILRSLGRELQTSRLIPSTLLTLGQPSPPQPHVQSPLRVYANKLRDLYAQSELPRYSNPACYKWTPSPSTKYIDLSTINRKNMTTQQVDAFKEFFLHGRVGYRYCSGTIKIEEILQAKPGEKLECVLVEGPPGIGKSTLAWQVCHRWGKRELFQQFSTVLLLPLRDKRVQDATCVEELFIDADRKLQDNVRREVSQKNWDGKDTLIILDGLDELPSHLLSLPSIFTALLSGTKFHQATILVTSRPSATKQLLDYWRPRLSRHFEIRGFTNRDVANYAQCVLSDYEQLSGFVEYSSHFQSMLYVPLHCVIAITIYLDCQQSRTPPPRTLTGLYICLTQTILTQYLKDHPQCTGSLRGNSLEKVFSLSVPHPVHSHFTELCRIAFEHINDQQLVFPDLPKELHDLGFTDAVPELLLYQQSANCSYNFLHLSIQEFLAAYHITLMNPNEQEQLIKSKWRESPFESMHQFFTGISKFEGVNRVVATQALGIDENLSMKSGSLKEYSLELLYECQDVNILDAEYTYSAMLTYPTPHLCLVLGYCIANSSCGWKIELLRCTTDKQAEMLLQGLIRTKIEACHTRARSRIECIRCLNCSTNFTHKIFTQHTPESLLVHIESLDIECGEFSHYDRFYHCQSLISFSDLPSHSFSPLPPCLPELIPRMKRLETLTLKNACATSLTEVIPVLFRVPTLRNLTISKLDLLEGIVLLSQWLPACHLETLTLNFSYFQSHDEPSIKELSRAITSVSSLKVLDMSESNFTFQSMLAFGKMLKQNKSITKLCIGDSRIDSNGAYYLAEALRHNTTLKVLDMSWNPIGERGALTLADILHNDRLEELSITDSETSSNGAVVMAKALYQSTHTTLRKFKVSSIDIEEKGVIAMAEMLKHNTTLEEVNLAGAKIGHNGAVAVAEALHHYPTLRKLHLSRNFVEDRGALAIAQMLQYNTTLEELYISYAGIGHNGAVAVAEALHHNPTLRKLHLSRNLVEDRGALAIAQMLQYNTTLEELYISYAGIGSDGVIAVAEAVHCNTALRMLDMSCNHSIAERGALAMAEMLRHNTTLKVLNLRIGFGIGHKVIKALLESLERNQHLKKLILSDSYKKRAESFSVYHDLMERVEWY